MIAVERNGQIYASSDGGVTWQTNRLAYNINVGAVGPAVSELFGTTSGKLRIYNGAQSQFDIIAQ